MKPNLIAFVTVKRSTSSKPRPIKVPCLTNIATNKSRPDLVLRNPRSRTRMSSHFTGLKIIATIKFMHWTSSDCSFRIDLLVDLKQASVFNLPGRTELITEYLKDIPIHMLEIKINTLFKYFLSSSNKINKYCSNTEVKQKIKLLMRPKQPIKNYNL